MARLRALFDELFKKFVWFDSRYFHPLVGKKMIKSIASEIKLSKNSKIIDIGCGSGWLTRDLARTIKNGEIVGIDILESSIQKVRAIAEKDTSFDYHNLTYKVANVESIPYPDNYFHLATTIASFSFWNDPIKSLKEIRRILKGLRNPKI